MARWLPRIQVENEHGYRIKYISRTINSFIQQFISFFARLPPPKKKKPAHSSSSSHSSFEPIHHKASPFRYTRNNNNNFCINLIVQWKTWPVQFSPYFSYSKNATHERILKRRGGAREMKIGKGRKGGRKEGRGEPRGSIAKEIRGEKRTRWHALAVISY